MDKKNVKEYIDLLEESNLSSLKIKTDKGELHIEKEKAHFMAEPVLKRNIEPHKQEQPVKPKKTLNAPMVATFYRASSPHNKPFVEIGDEIKKGDVVCILEAMKVMNEIKSDMSGVLKEILVEDSMSVEFDQPLFVIE